MRIPKAAYNHESSEAVHINEERVSIASIPHRCGKCWFRIVKRLAMIRIDLLSKLSALKIIAPIQATRIIQSSGP